MKRKILILSGTILLCSACANSQTNPSTPQADTITTFTLPAIPAALQVPEARAEYLITHYWDHINFADTNYVHHDEIIEQAWVNYIDLLPFLPLEAAAEAITRTMKQAEASKPCLLYLASLADKYLYDPNSPMRNEEYYIPVLSALVTSPLLSDVEKIRPRARHELALKNRVGTPAIDFVYTLASGKSGTLYGISAPYTLLYINNPECHTCAETTEALQHSPVIAQAIRTKELAVLSLYPDEEIEAWKAHLPDFPSTWTNAYDVRQTVREQQLYDLKAIPTLYLLDKEKNVLLKDTTVEAIEEFLTVF